MYTSVKYRLTICLMLVVLGSVAAAGADLKPEEVLQKHLASIGTPEARAAAKSRVVEANLSYKILQGGSGEYQGKGVVASTGDKMQLMLKVTTLKYHGEKFVRDGGKTFVAGTYDDGSRSEFGEFLRAEDAALREGLLGGMWSTGWALLDSDAEKKIHPQGVKKVDGVEYYVVSYRPKKAGDLDITLYFEPSTFRHVMTVYKASLHAGIAGTNADARMGAPALPGRGSGNDLSGGADTASARQQETRYRIEERFSDFTTQDGLTLPSHYDLRFQEELTSFTKVVDWNLTSTRLLDNPSLDPRNFEIR